MKFMKWLMAIIAAAALAFGIFAGVKLSYRWTRVMGAADKYGGDTVASPTVYMWLTIASALVFGLALGLALGLPSRTAHSIRKLTRSQIEAERQADAARAQQVMSTERDTVRDDRI